MKHGFVYLIRAKGTNLYKIGVTDRRIANRLKELQTGSPIKLELVESIASDNYETIERNLHQIWSKNRAQGEWFEFDDVTPVIQTLRSSERKRLSAKDAFCTAQSAFSQVVDGLSLFQYVESLDEKSRLDFISDFSLWTFTLLIEIESAVNDSKQKIFDLQDIELPEEVLTPWWWKDDPDAYNEASGCFD